VVADLLVPGGGSNCLSEFLPSAAKSSKGSLDLDLVGPVLADRSLICVPELSPQRGHLLGHLVPGIGIWPGISLGCVDRIVFVRLHLLDGTYELFRAFFGFPPRLAPDGREVGATLGVIETTLSLLREPDVTHLAVATDTVIESFRNEMFPGYKTGAGVDPNLMSQFPLIEEALDILGVVCWGMIEYEADDAIATAALRWVEDVDQVVIATPDKDLTQCVIGDRIVTLNRRQQTIMNEDGVREKFGVSPESIPDYLALVGDTADGVPGLPGWGPKSASLVLARWRKIEAIPGRASDWEVTVRGAERLATTLVERRSDAFLYRDLTTLRFDVPLAETLADLEWRGVRRDQFLELCDELGFDDVRTRPHRWQ